MDKPETVAGALTHGVTQFTVGFIPIFRGVKVLRPLQKMGSLSKSMIAGAATDFTVFNPHEACLSDLAESFPELSNYVTRFLKSDPNDSAAEGRLKNALEGLIVGLVAEPFMRSLRLLKYARIRLPIVEVRTKRHYELEAVKLDNNGEYFGKLVPRELANGTFIGNKVENSVDVVIKNTNKPTKYKLDFENNKFLDIENMSKSDILNNLPKGWKYTENNNFIHVRDLNGNIRMKIDLPDKVTRYHHIHLFDNNGNPIDKNGNIVNRKSPEARIPYKN